ncbi:MAG TPA: hypothetical protein VFU46_06660 [Gemmatimonadales bacterium]|nr:hypothetical protein [Gemmatimonadales bacterium]
MTLLLAATLALLPAGPQTTAAVSPLLTTDGAVCVATGYCTRARSGEPNRPPAGPMYIAIGLIGIGLASLRRQPADE